MSTALTLNDTLPTGNMDSYIGAAFQLPLLSAEEEYALAKELKEKQNLDAAQKLIMSHLRFVVRIARSYNGYGLPQNDLIQEGSIGLMKAVKRFDPDFGVRLVSFAVHWIRAEIHEYVIRNWRIVKVATTKAQRKLFFNLRSSKKRLGWFSQQEVEEVAQDLGVKPETVLEMESRLSGSDIGFDADDQDDDESYHAPSHYLADNSMEPLSAVENADTTEQQHQRLSNALMSLDDRSQAILQARWLNENKRTLHELADEYQVSAERIRQIEKAAMNKIKSQLM